MLGYKYINTFGNTEAEAVMDVLDRHNGDQEAARMWVADTLGTAIEKEKRNNKKEADYQAALNLWEANKVGRIKKLFGHRDEPMPVKEAVEDLTGDERDVMAIIWATGGCFWWDGLERLEKLGKITVVRPVPEVPPAQEEVIRAI